MGRIKTVVTNHLRKMSRSRIHKAAERNTAAWINSDKLIQTNSQYFHKPFVTGTSNYLLTVITSVPSHTECLKDQSSRFCDCFFGFEMNC